MLSGSIISIGDELLIGQTINTNASFIAKALTKAHIDVQYIYTISDKQSAIIDTLEACKKRTDITIITGGLGPTNDDITKHVLCEIFNTKLIRNPKALEHIQRYFEARKRQPNNLNYAQADLPENAHIIYNTKGTASGMIFTEDGFTCVSLPGVPFEMQNMLPHVIEYIKHTQPNIGRIHTENIITQGIGESVLAQKLEQWEHSLSEQKIRCAYLPSVNEVKIRLTSHAHTGQTDIEKKIQELQLLIPRHFVGIGDIPIETRIAKFLTTHNKTLSVAESCTGGRIAHSFIQLSNCSAYFEGGFIVYNDAQKIQQLGVCKDRIETHTAYSKEVANCMATKTRQKMQTDFAIASSGIMESDTEKTGVWISISSDYWTKAKYFPLHFDRKKNIESAVKYGLQFLFTYLSKL